MARKHFQRGSLFQRGKSNKVWVARWWEEAMGFDGKRIRVRRSEILGCVKDLPTRSQAEQILAKRLRAVNAHNYSLKPTRKFSDFVREDWQAVVLPTMKYATQRSYEYLLRVHLLPAFGDLFLGAISRETVQAFLNSKLAKGLAWQTVHHLQCGVSKIMNTAMEWGYIEQNVVRLTRLPRRPRRPAKVVITPEQLRALLAALPEPSRSLVFLLTVTGLRIGELLSLRWRHVDWQLAVLRIEETVHEGHFDDPKSKRSMRSVPLGSRAFALLAQRYETSNRDGDGLVFASRRGTPLDRRSLLARQLKPAAEAIGLRGVIWHLLRHSNASLHDSVGTPLGTLQELLGHCSSEITRQIYLHSIPADRRQAVKNLERLLFGPKLDPNAEAPRLTLPQTIETREELGRGDRI
jgi:integrase